MEELDIFNMSADDKTLDVFEGNNKANDGFYKPKLDEAIDKTKGYKAIIRFLPNFTKEGKLGSSAIEKHLHYANMQANPELGGYYDCEKSTGNKHCELCTEFFKLFNSDNAADKERAKQISRQTKYYSYVLVIDDKQHPDWNGKIMIFPYGKQISTLIQQERKGEITDEPCNVFDLGKGKDFVLLIKEKSNFPTYESSSFRNESSIKIPNEKGELKNVPVEDGKIVDKTVQGKVIKFLSERDVQLEDNMAKTWDDETKTKVQNIVNVLEGKGVVVPKTDPFGDETETLDNTPDDFGEDNPFLLEED